MKKGLSNTRQAPSLRIIYDHVLASLLAGLLSAVVMSVVLVLAYVLMKKSILIPFQLLAVTLIGESALLPSAGIAEGLTGLFSLWLAGAVFGTVYGMVIRSRIYSQVALYGIAYALGIWCLFDKLLFPAGLNLPLTLRMPPEILAISAGVYGLFLATLIPFEKLLIKNEIATHGGSVMITELLPKSPPTKQRAA